MPLPEITTDSVYNSTEEGQKMWFFDAQICDDDSLQLLSSVNRQEFREKLGVVLVSPEVAKESKGENGVLDVRNVDAIIPQISVDYSTNIPKVYLQVRYEVGETEADKFNGGRLVKLGDKANEDYLESLKKQNV